MAHKRAAGVLFDDAPTALAQPVTPPVAPPRCSTYRPVVDRTGDDILVSPPGSTERPHLFHPCAHPAAATRALFRFDGMFYQESE